MDLQKYVYFMLGLLDLFIFSVDVSLCTGHGRREGHDKDLFAFYYILLYFE